MNTPQLPAPSTAAGKSETKKATEESGGSRWEPSSLAALPIGCARAISGSTRPISNPSLCPRTPKRDLAALLPVADSRGLFLGTALYSPSSQIALRLVSRQALDQAGWLKLLEARLRAAIARRKPLLDAANDACRLCFSEADELPGLVADKYGELVIVQFLAKGCSPQASAKRASACCAKS